MVSQVLAAARDLVQSGRRGILVTVVQGSDTGSMSLVDAGGVLLAGPILPTDVLGAVERLGGGGNPEVVESAGTAWFVEPVVPPPRMIVLGAIAVADVLVPMATIAGFAVQIVDPRPWLVTPDRYPMAAAIHCGVPTEILETLDIDGSTAIVSFLHEPRLEDPVLRMALERGAGYVGSMGSRRTTESKRERLAASGIDADTISRVSAPIGLAIGAVEPREIAVAVLAEVVAVMRGLR